MAQLKVITPGAKPLASDVNQVVKALQGSIDIGSVNLTAPVDGYYTANTILAPYGTGNLTGTYHHYLIKVTGWKDEYGNMYVSGYTPTPNEGGTRPTVTVSSQQVAVTIPAFSDPVIAVMIYRTTTNGSGEYVGMYTNSQGGTYYDNLPDAQVATAYTTAPNASSSPKFITAGSKCGAPPHFTPGTNTTGTDLIANAQFKIVGGITPSYSWNSSIAAGATVTITHNLNRQAYSNSPLVLALGTVASTALSWDVSSWNAITVKNSGTATWYGYINLY